MKLLQKIEFWLFSVPALVVAIGGVAHYGAWRVLWVFLIGYALAAVVQFSKGKVYKALEGPRVFAASAVSIGVVVVAAHGALYYKRERKRFLKTRELQSASEIAVAAAKERRKLKRERQMMAFRRSHRG